MPKRPSSRRFASELKRRHVYRVGAMYAAAAFVLWQATDIAFSALGFAESWMRVVVVTALLGFPVALVLAWVYELTPEGIRFTSRLDRAHGRERSVVRASRKAVRKRAAVGGVVILVVLGLGWWTMVARSPTAPLPPNEYAVAVFPFSIRGAPGFEYLQEGMVDLLSRNLSGAAGMEPVDASMVLAVTGGGSPTDPQAAAEMARRAGAGSFVMGSVTVAAGQIRIDASLHRASAANGRAPHGVTVQGDTTEVFGLLDVLTSELLLGSEAGAASERLIRTAVSTTTSLDALKAYLEGERRFRQGEHADGITAFRTAVEMDSTFALARYRLALSHHMRGEHVVALREVDGALRHLDRLHAHEKRVIEAFHLYHRGSVRQAESLLRTAITEHPHDLEARLILGELLLQYAPARGRPISEARELLEAIIEADPRFVCIHCQLANMALVEGDADAADQWLRLNAGRATGDTTGYSSDSERMALAALRGDLMEMQELVAALDTLPPDRFVSTALGSYVGFAIQFGRWELAEQLLEAGAERGAPPAVLEPVRALWAMSRGRFAEADKAFAAFRSAGGVQATVGPRLGMLLLYAPVDLHLQSHELLVQDMRELPPSLVEGAADLPTFQRLSQASRHFVLGLAMSRIRERSEALAHADSLEAMISILPGDEDILHGLARTLRADVAYRDGDLEAARVAFEGVSAEVPPELLAGAFAAPFYAVLLRAEVHGRLGNHAEAIRWLEHGVRVMGAPRPGAFASWHLSKGRALDGLGRTAEARPHFEAFVRAWEGADPELRPHVEDAQAWLARN